MLSSDTKSEAEQLYKKLSAGRKIETLFEKMFWGDWLASFADPYGIQWMIDAQDI